MTDISYVTVTIGKRKSMYTYQAKTPVEVGGSVWVNTLSGPKPVPVIAVSSKPPSKKPAPDGYKGEAKSRILRKA